MARVSITRSIQVRDPSALPSWRSGLAVNQWTELAGTAMSNFPPTVDPDRDSGGPYAKMDTWCGLAIDTRTNEVWSVANGGHDDYHGNEVMKFTLGSNTPEWIEVTPSNSALDFTIPSNTARYSNGAPVSAHSYGLQTVIEARNRAIRFGVGAAASSGNPFAAVDGFNVLTTPGANGWDASSTYPDVPNWYLTGASACKDSDENVYVVITNYYVFKWTQATNTWSTLVSGGGMINGVDGYYAALAYDSLRNRILLLNTQSASLDLNTNTWTLRSIPTVSGQVHGMVYSPSHDAYFVRRAQDAGGTVYKIDASTFAVTTLATTGGASIPANAGTGVYTRWLLAPSLSGIVYFPRYTANAWFLRIE